MVRTIRARRCSGIEARRQAVLKFGSAGRRGREARLGPIFGVTALDPVTYAAVPALLIAAGVLASYLPARRAVTLDPVQALRAE